MNIKILQIKDIPWREAKWFQNEALKEMSEQQLEKLKNSFKKNDFIAPFFVWQENDTIHILDGHHRQKALLELEKDGYHIPDLLPAVFVDCKDRKQASELVLVYSSHYANITKEGLEEFAKIHDIDLTEMSELNFEGIDSLDFSTELPNVDAPVREIGNLNDTFGVPPFSILDTRQGYWQTQKKAWREIINDDGESRENTLRTSASGNDPAYYRKKTKKEQELGRKLSNKDFEENYYTVSEHENKGILSGVSLLDPVLAEIACKWFGLPNCKTFDCFAGDTVFGYVSAHLGNEFTGIELREEQVNLNNSRVAEFPNAQYICDDGQNVAKHIAENSQDLLFSCPPYFDLEVYSDLENDASNQGSYEDFLKILENAFSNAIKCLKENRFAVITVGDVRDEKGAYYGFPQDIKAIFCKNGLHFYNELILIEMSGNASMRASNQMKNRKVVKVHQNVLVFYKGNLTEIKNNFPKLEQNFPIDEQEELIA